MSVAFCCGSGAWCRVWHIPGRCRQPPAASARSRSGCRSHPSLASQNQARSSRSAPAAARGGGAPSSQAAPPALAPLAPATGRSPPPRLQSSAPRLRHRLPSSPRACGPRAAAAAHHFGSCLAFVASALISRSFVAVAAGPCASRHPPRKNFGRWGQAVLVFETVAAEPTESRCAASTFSR